MEKRTVTIVDVDDTLESAALRAVLENLNYRVTVHWTGSRKELLKIVGGEIETDEMVIVSCHGKPDGIQVPDEAPLSPEELGASGRLDGKTVISTGCVTGTPAFAEAFKKAGADHYVAPVDYPDGSAALAFVTNLFLLLSYDTDLAEAVQRAADFHDEMKQFRLLT